jgi:hypothetical protein
MTWSILAERSARLYAYPARDISPVCFWRIRYDTARCLSLLASSCSCTSLALAGAGVALTCNRYRCGATTWSSHEVGSGQPGAPARDPFLPSRDQPSMLPNKQKKPCKRWLALRSIDRFETWGRFSCVAPRK